MEKPHRPRGVDGKFTAGQPGPIVRGQRRRGSPNRITRDIKQGVIGAAIEHGLDGSGERGFEGYCYYLASKHPKAFVQLLGKLLPLKLEGNLLDAPGSIFSVQIVQVPADRYLTAEAIEELRATPVVIDHESDPALEPELEFEPSAAA